MGADVAKEFKKIWDGAREANKLAAGAAPAAPSPAKAAPAAAAAKAVEDNSGPIPVTDNLDTVYGADKGAEMAARYGNITESYRNAFGGEPTFYVRAPGRVNLIGEHIDYHGYSVFPMALQTQDVVIAVGVVDASAGVKVANTNTRWEMGNLPIDPSVEVNRAVHKWFNYVHCGYKGAFDAAAKKGKTVAPVGIQMMIDGAVPPGAGVSSSSALVVASLLAVARANSISDSMTRADLGEAGRACELHIGTMSGGMDQAASAMGEMGRASRIDFEPLRATAIALPSNAAFVVSNTLEVSAKAEESEKRYNMRVTEGKLACKLVAKSEGLPNWRTITTFRHLQETLKAASPGDLLPAIEKALKPGAYSSARLATSECFGESCNGLFEGDDKRAGALKVLAAYPSDATVFELLKRARHVCSEAERVWQFQYAAEGKGVEGGEEVQLKRLGELMSASQGSCRDDYECSSEGLDTLCKLAMDSGISYGSRLTGAGWGGCAVHLVHKSKVASFVEAMKVYGQYKGKEASFVAQSLFASAPGSGAAIYTPAASFEI